ncbi:(S)-ureidoglycine aminohydrolase [Clostridium butyricum]|uniref:(S)-ureidoglycine aminohydrolase n=1 Tax=Clostridium butyricum TaxID=1492 RepID=UPI00129A4391|nr:(S)-ureidoglycine aminohydrolase [Clostridium butyricum]MDB2161889.1 (S)-ureidoglycine aminohydrolase [Clostridium butyricum]QGH20393.1 cupin domain-containing protein [Clostridium butyricum]
MGYPKDLLSTRAVVKPGLYAVIPKDGLVNNVIPNIVDCRISIVASPKMGASFVQYIIDVNIGGGTSSPFATEENIESFIYCVNGKIDIKIGDNTDILTDGGYAFAPAGCGLSFKNIGDENAKILLYKQVYIPLEGKEAKICIGNVNNIEYRIYDDMENVYIKDLLPTDLGYDMNMHILAFEPGGCHPIVETHVQEHGAYILSGEGMYLLDDTWMGIKKEDFIWFGPYVAQCAYGVGRELFAYIYSKDCNRDVSLL